MTLKTFQMSQIQLCLYMMSNSKYFPLLILCVSILSACHRELTENVSKMMHKSVQLNTADMDIVNQHGNIYNSVDSNNTFTLVVFNDESDCMSCKVSKLNEWHRFLTQVYDAHHGVNVCYIFSPNNENISNVRTLLSEQNFRHPVFIDSNHIFKKANQWIPLESMYHTFLLDKDNKIVLVGNPLQNQKINQMFFEIIKEQHN